MKCVTEVFGEVEEKGIDIIGLLELLDADITIEASVG